MNMMNQAAAVLAAAGGLFFLRSEYERNQFVTERFEVCSPKLKGTPKRYVFLTDLHDKEFGMDNERLLAAIREENPDAVLIGGDMMVAKGIGDLTVSLKFLRALSKEFPIYHANGNHELRMKQERHIYGEKYQQYRKALHEMGVVFLSDSRISLSEDIDLYGLNLTPEHYSKGYPKMKPDFVKRVLGTPEQEKISILLAHSPMFFYEYAAWGADVTLSGHFHGGTIRLPFLGGLMTPQYQFFFPWCSGCFSDKKGRKLIVGRGLGTHSINIRINNKPQVVVLIVKK